MEIVRLPKPTPAVSCFTNNGQPQDDVMRCGDVRRPSGMLRLLPRISRVPPLLPLTRAQRLVALMVGMGSKYSEVAEILGISCFTVKRHAEDAAAKIPGNLATQTRLIMWVRGASLEELDGSSLRVTVAQGVDSLIEPEDAEFLAPVIGTSDERDSHAGCAACGRVAQARIPSAR